MIVKLLTEHHLEFLSFKEAAEARLSLHLSKCRIVGNLMPRLIVQFVLLSMNMYAVAMLCCTLFLVKFCKLY